MKRGAFAGAFADLLYQLCKRVKSGLGGSFIDAGD